MLELARERCATAGVEVDLRLGDMREFALDEPAGLIYCPFRSLNHLPTWADRRAVFERVAAGLRPGGRFAWNAFVYDPHVAARDDGRAQPREGGRIWEYVKHFPADSRIEVTTYVGGPGQEPRTVSFWWVTRSEWEGLIEVAGLEVEELCGWFDRRPFDESSREFVWIARKPERVTDSPYDAIAELYDPWSRSVTEDVVFYVDEARAGRRAGGRAGGRHGAGCDPGRGRRDPRDRRRLVGGDAGALPRARPAGRGRRRSSTCGSATCASRPSPSGCRS